jgi:PAS domain S-box-containing protein
MVAVAEPLAAHRADWQRPLIGLAAGGALALLGGCALAFWLARRLLAPLAALTDRAQAVAAAEGGDAGGLPPEAEADPMPRVREFAALRDALDRADAALRRRAETERAAAAALRDGESRLRSVVDTAVDGIVVAAADGRIVLANPAAHRMFGYDEARQDLLGRSLSLLMPQAEVARHAGGRLAARGVVGGAGGPSRVIGVPGRPLLGRRRDGTQFPIDLSVGSFRSGEAPFFTGVVRDATERKAVEAALRASEARAMEALALLRSIYDTVPVGLALLDRDLRFVSVNARLAAMNGVAPEAHRGRTLREILPRRADALEPVIRGVLRTGTPVTDFEIAAELRSAPGETRHWMCSWHPVRDPVSGAVRGVGTVVADVTERRRIEARELLVREVDHRAKNLLAVVQAVLSLTPREGEGAERFAEAVSGRIRAMARAHDLLARESWTGAELRGLAAAELAPYAGGVVDRLCLRGPPLRLPAEVAQPVSMMLHELATNAAKYGALSAPAGRLALAWGVADAPGGGGPALRLEWEERGGPVLPGPPRRAGFGSRLIERLARQAGGSAAFAWEPDGLRCVLLMPLARARAAAA